MKVSYYLALATLSLLTMSNSCRKDEDAAPCTATLAVLETTPIPGLRATITEPIPSFGQSNDYVVNSDAEYRALFGKNKLPPVDFTAYTLLAGKTRTATGSTVATQAVTQTCNSYKYTIKLAATQRAKPTNVSYYVLVPKLPVGAKVEFDVQLPPAAAASN